MRNLRIEQNNITEVVTAEVLQKLYQVVSAVDFQTGVLKGNLQSEHATQTVYDYLTGSVNGQKRFPDLNINVTGGIYIDFADPEAERLCALYFSSDGVGCTAQDLQSLRSSVFVGARDSVFTGNTTMTSFDEFQYFKDPSFTELPTNMFKGCTNLTSVIFPDNITSIRSKAVDADQPFGQCSSLVNVQLPSRLGNITSKAFAGCTSLQSINIPGSMSIIDRSVFDGCSSLQNVTLNSGVQQLWEACFQSTAITSITIPNTVSYISGAFYECSNLSQVTFEEGNTPLKVVGSTSLFAHGPFYNCSSLTKVVFPERLNELEGRALSTNKNVTFEFKTSTPPTWTNPSQQGNGTTTVIVPDGARDAYLNAPGFSEFTTQYKVIKEKSQA